MMTVAISDFRANLSKYLNLANQGEEMTITSKGRELATLKAPKTKKEKAQAILDEVKKTAVIGDLISPIDVEWDAMK